MIIYKVLYNYFLAQRKYPTNPKVMACATTTLFIILLLLNIAACISLCCHLNFIPKTSKAMHALIFAVVFYAVYLVQSIFVKSGIGEGQEFNISVRTRQYTWLVFIINFVLVFILALVKKAILH